jgi:hypothetical protein
VTESEAVENYLVNEALKSLLLLLMIVITQVNTLVAFVGKQLCYNNKMGHIIPTS